MLRSRTLATAATLTFVLGFALFATVFIVPVFAQRLLGYTALKTGMLFLPGAVVAVVCPARDGQDDRQGRPAAVSWSSPASSIVRFFALHAVRASTSSAGADDFFWPIILRAIGLSLITIPLTQLAVSGLQPRDMPQGVALNNMMRQMGGSFGIAFINTFLDHRTPRTAWTWSPAWPPGDPATDGRLAQLTHAMLAKGAAAWEAPHRALGLLDADRPARRRASSAISTPSALWDLFALFCVPLILIAGRPAASRGSGSRSRQVALISPTRPRSRHETTPQPYSALARNRRRPPARRDPVPARSRSRRPSRP